MAPVKDFSERTWERRQHEPGTIATVIAVLPKTGNNPEMLKIRVGRHGTEEYVTSNAVVMHRIAGRPLDPGRGIRSRPVPEGRAITRARLPEGGRYAVVRPTRGRQGSRGVPDYSKQEHALKGSFVKEQSVTGFSNIVHHEGQNLRSFIYEAKRPDEGGTVVWVHRYSDDKTGRVRSTVIGEVNYHGDKKRYGTPKEFTYNNPAKAFKTLRDRYGISMTMKEWRYR